jgi:predicted hydrocarbon binding protein
MTHQIPSSELRGKMGTILFKAMEETIDRKDLHKALDYGSMDQPESRFPLNSQWGDFQCVDINRVQDALEQLYGLRGSQGLALRSGRACFKYGLREFGDQLGFSEIDFRLLPLNLKILTAAQQFASSINKASHHKISIEEDKSHFHIYIQNCPICQDRHSKNAICHMAVGLVQEALYWISGGKYFQIEETDCIAKGDPCCTLVIQKHPLE